MPDLYSRFGQIFTRAVHDHLAKTQSIEVPFVGACTIENLDGPRIHHSNWLFTFDLRFPNSYSSMTLGVSTFGSCLMPDAEKLPLPPADFEDDTEKEFPAAHQQAWLKLLDDVESTLQALGLSDDLDTGDFYLIQDYYPSRGISGSLRKPSAVNTHLATACQKLLQKHSGWDFWIQFDLDFADARYKGKDERILIREDRIVLDLNVARLRQEFTTEFSWSSG